MAPTLADGQTVVVELGPGRLRRGDVLLFRQGECLLLHRMLGPARRRAGGEACLRTRGDGATPLDPPLPRSQVLGRVIALRQARGWRSMRGRRAQFYGWCLAWHALFWSAVATAAHRLGTRLGAPGAQGAVVRADRALLGVAHALAFRLAHPRAADPLLY